MSQPRSGANLVSKGRKKHKIMVLWPTVRLVPGLNSESPPVEFGQRGWFEAVITDYNEETETHILQYADGDTERVNLLKLSSQLPAWELVPCTHCDNKSWFDGRA